MWLAQRSGGGQTGSRRICRVRVSDMMIGLDVADGVCHRKCLGFIAALSHVPMWVAIRDEL